MKALDPDEKAVTVMIYTRNLFVRADIVIQKNLRANIWLRTQGVLNYIHLLKANAVLLTGTQPRTLAYTEMFVPISEVTAYHLAPPAQEVLDFDTSELHRTMQAVDISFGSFMLKGKIRISTQTDLMTNLDVSHATWMSVYDAEVSNLYLPQFDIQVPMLLVNPAHVSFGIV